MSDTPRTDAVERCRHPDIHSHLEALRDLARTLERELAEARELLRETLRLLKSCTTAEYAASHKAKADAFLAALPAQEPK